MFLTVRNAKKSGGSHVPASCVRTHVFYRCFSTLQKRRKNCYKMQKMTKNDVWLQRGTHYQKGVGHFCRYLRHSRHMASRMYAFLRYSRDLANRMYAFLRHSRHLASKMYAFLRHSRHLASRMYAFLRHSRHLASRMCCLRHSRHLAQNVYIFASFRHLAIRM